jgi:hypothetical protein
MAWLPDFAATAKPPSIDRSAEAAHSAFPEMPFGTKMNQSRSAAMKER